MPQSKTEEILCRLKRIEEKIDEGKLISRIQ